MEAADPLLQGLKLYEPRTFLFLENFLTTVQTQPQRVAIGVVIAGAFLLLFGLPFRRASAAVTLGALLWAVFGIIAMAAHASFPALTIPALIVGVLLGAWKPRFAHALVAMVLLALVTRSIVLFVDGDLAIYGVLAGGGVGFVVALLAWESWVAFATSVIGAILVAYSLSPLLGDAVPAFSAAQRSSMAALYGGLAALFFLIGLVVQLRTGEITWLRASAWKIFVKLRALRKKKKPAPAKAVTPPAKPAEVPAKKP